MVYFDPETGEHGEGEKKSPEQAEMSEFDKLAKKYEDIKERYLLYRDASTTVDKVQGEAGLPQKAKEKAVELKVKIETARANEQKYLLDPGALMNHEAAIVHRAHGRLLKILERPAQPVEGAQAEVAKRAEAVQPKPEAEAKPQPKAPEKKPAAAEVKLDYEKPENRFRAYAEALVAANGYLNDDKSSPELKKYAGLLVKIVEDFRRGEQNNDGWSSMAIEVNNYRKAITALAEGRATATDQRRLQNLEKATTPPAPKKPPQAVAKRAEVRAAAPKAKVAPKAPEAKPPVQKPAPQEQPKKKEEPKKPAPPLDLGLAGFGPRVRGPSAGPEEGPESRTPKALLDAARKAFESGGHQAKFEKDGIKFMVLGSSAENIRVKLDPEQKPYPPAYVTEEAVAALDKEKGREWGKIGTDSYGKEVRFTDRNGFAWIAVKRAAQGLRVVADDSRMA